MQTVQDILLLLIWIGGSILVAFATIALCDYYLFGSRNVRQEEKKAARPKTFIIQANFITIDWIGRDMVDSFEYRVNVDNALMRIWLPARSMNKVPLYLSEQDINLYKAIRIKYNEEKISISQAVDMFEKINRHNELIAAKELIRQYDKDNNYKFINEI